MIEKSNFTASECVRLMKEWQSQYSKKIVRVSNFSLCPQTGDGIFFLGVEFFIADNGVIEKNFFGTFEDCFNQAVDFMIEERERLRNLL